jgi:pseudaminic acid biosynthesis-associated methylase
MTGTEPREVWRGAFGDAYTDRNPRAPDSVQRRAHLFARALASIPIDASTRVLEVGTNLGMNLSALRTLWPVSLFGVDLNESSLGRARREPDLVGRARLAVAQAEWLPFRDASLDLVLTCGVLIHVPPDRLRQACAEMVRVSRRYLFCAEYFSARPEAIEYRGESGLLFKRDFGGFFLDHWPELRVLDYGFVWKRVAFGDLTWWLFEKPGTGGR